MASQLVNSTLGLRAILTILIALYLIIQVPLPAHSSLLDSSPGALAAYSLRRLSASYSGPAIRVRRTSDNQALDINFTAGGNLDTTALLAFVGSANGEVVKWYSQIPGHPSLIPPTGMLPPLIVEQGALIVDQKSLPRLKFFRADALRVEDPGYSTDFDDANVTVHLLIENQEQAARHVAFQIMEYGWQGHSFTLYGGSSYWLSHPESGFGDAFTDKLDHTRNIVTLAVSPTSAQMYQNHEKVADQTVTATSSLESHFVIGARGRSYIGDWSGYVSEVVIYPYISNVATIRSHTDNINSYWQTGPSGYNPAALMPQKYQYQVDLYDWLETISTADLTLPTGTLQWDEHYANTDALSDIWMFFAPHKAATLSRVTRQESKRLVLNDGNGGGIEGSGEVLLLHGTGGNNRSWGNEPAYWYALNLPMANGSNGNPYYKKRALCIRALVITAVDLLMYDRELDGGGWATWNDMHGKALLSWSEAVYTCKTEINPSVLAAFEAGFKRNLEISIETGIRDANTNMDMFPVEAMANIAKYSSDANLKDTALQAAKRLLLGYTDGVLFTHHDWDAGAFFPAGYIGENDMADAFYNGESFYHLAGAWAKTHNIAGWEWMGEVLKRMSLWRIYHAFPEPHSARYNGPSGYSGRTSAISLSGQQSLAWRDVTAADLIQEARPLLTNFAHGGFNLPQDENSMVADINRTITSLQSDWGVTDSNPAPKWNGWSPWPKIFPYLPPAGWYTRLKNLVDSQDPSITPPIDLANHTFTRAFGGPPTGMEFWAYRNNHQNRDFGWYVEADAQQGTYGGWYGGKLELFWTRSTGPVIINRHGKTGCDADDNEDSTCWEIIERWGAHHVWGRDESSNPFSPIHLKGRALARTATYSAQATPKTVEVVNVFNDPNAQKSGEQQANVIEGQLSITNKFEAVDNGILISHTLRSDRVDQLSELWATIPVSLGETDSDSTSIEYLLGSAWLPLTTTPVSTTKIRLGKNIDGTHYVYVNFIEMQNVRLSSSEYKSPYQTSTRIRNIHIDMHGNPGATIYAPSELSLSYGINTSDSIVNKPDQLSPASHKP